MANVDTAEIEKFENLASRWWDKNSEFKPLHDINPLRANYIDRRSPVAERLLLDVGCGGGILTEAMAQRGAKATGIDMGAAPLAVARPKKVSWISITNRSPPKSWPRKHRGTTTLSPAWKCLSMFPTRPPWCKPARVWCVPVATSIFPLSTAHPRRTCLPYSAPNTY